LRQKEAGARFYAPDIRQVGDEVSLPEDEAQHLTRVLRLREDAVVRVFDGRGREYEARVAHAGRDDVRIVVNIECQPPSPETRVAVTLAPAALKGDKMDDVVRDAVMIGVAAIQPVVSTRSEVSLAALTRGQRQARWQRIAVASAKQCGRAVVPPVAAPCTLDALLLGMEERRVPAPGLMLAEPRADAEMLALRDLAVEPPRETTLLIGPEGGWTGAELSRAAATCRFLRLGERTLRADATPLVALAALLAHWGEL
jgi:16S rRNA (uracil1498-N3)-methyltransferase